MHRRLSLLARWEPQTFLCPDGDGGGGGGAGGGGAAAVVTKIELTQEELDRIKSEEFGKGKRLGSDGAALAKTERERLAALEKDAAEREKADKAREEKLAIERGDFEKARGKVIDSAKAEERAAWEPKLSEAQKQIERLQGRFGGLLKDKVKAAAAAKAFNPDQVVALLVGHRVRLNADLDPEVLDEAGEPALVGGKPMSIDQLVDGYLAANPNLVKSAGGQGGGSGGGASLKGGDASEIDKLQAAVDEAAKKWQQSRSSADLTEHRRLNQALNEARSKAGK